MLHVYNSPLLAVARIGIHQHAYLVNFKLPDRVFRVPTGSFASYICARVSFFFVFCSRVTPRFSYFSAAVQPGGVVSFEGPEWGFKSTGPQRAACLRAMAKAIEDDKDVSAPNQTFLNNIHV